MPTEAAVNIGRLLDSVIQKDFRLKYDGNIDDGIELIYSERSTGDQYRITIEKES